LGLLFFGMDSQRFPWHHHILLLKAEALRTRFLVSVGDEDIYHAFARCHQCDIPGFIVYWQAMTFSKRDDEIHEQLYPQRSETSFTLSNSLLMSAERRVSFAHGFVNSLRQTPKILDE
jgi:hypothetical protein